MEFRNCAVETERLKVQDSKNGSFAKAAVALLRPGFHLKAKQREHKLERDGGENSFAQLPQLKIEIVSGTAQKASRRHHFTQFSVFHLWSQ